MPIGRFARASRLSVKSLRNYDESGLLPAAFVDPQSGYRYYRLEQLARADAIRSLRMVEMPLPVIADVLDNDEPDELLLSHLAALEEQRDELERKAQELKQRIGRKEYALSTDVTLKVNPAIVAIGWRTQTTHIEIFNDIPAGFGTVIGQLAEADVDPTGPPFTLYHQAPDGDTAGDISMCVPVAAEMAESMAVNGLTVFEVDEGAAASIVHRGGYDDMGESYATAMTWIQERGHHLLGPAREVYLNSPAEVGEADLRTEILFPIDGETAVETDGRTELS